MPWTLVPLRVAITNASTAAESTLPKNTRSQSCSAANVNSLAAVKRRTAPIGAKAAIRHTVPKQKKAQPPGIRIKASKRKKKDKGTGCD